MTNSYKFDNFPYILILICIYCIVFVFEMFWIALVTLIVIILIPVIPWLNNKRKKIIIKLKQYFLPQVISTLRNNSVPYKKLVFPEQLNHWYEISGNHKSLNSFLLLRPLIGLQLKNYQSFCIQLDAIIKNLRICAKEIIHRGKTNNGKRYMLIDKYKDYSENQRNALLKKEGLFENVKIIEDFRKELPDKSKGLLNKFEEIIVNWEDILEDREEIVRGNNGRT